MASSALRPSVANGIAQTPDALYARVFPLYGRGAVLIDDGVR